MLNFWEKNGKGNVVIFDVATSESCLQQSVSTLTKSGSSLKLSGK